MLQATPEELLVRLGRAGNPRASRQVRLVSPADRAAFSLVHWRRAGFSQQQYPCGLCGAITCAFCEACLWRGRDTGASRNAVPFAVCETCDMEARVCNLCQSAGYDHTSCQLRYEQQYPGTSECKAIVVFGANRDSTSTLAGCYERFDSPRYITAQALGYADTIPMEVFGGR